MSPDRQVARRPARRLVLACCLAAAAAIAALPRPAAWGQDHKQRTLRLVGIRPAGARSSVTESWGTLEVTLTNWSKTDRLARVFFCYDNEQDIQYGRQVRVPARSTLMTWLLAGPAASQPAQISRTVRTFVYDRSGGTDQQVLPSTQERINTPPVPYRKRDPYTVLYLDEVLSEESAFGQLPQPETPADEALWLVRTFRQIRGLSSLVQGVAPSSLPPVPAAFDGVDHFVVASGRLGQDRAGMTALRRWLEQGGRIWVMLDQVNPDALAPLLGDAFDFQVVDRVGLTSFRIESDEVGREAAEAPLQHHDRPVELVRVLLPASEKPRHTVNGWPAWFTRTIGRGKVVFTALGPRGWYRPRRYEPAAPGRPPKGPGPRGGDPKSPFPQFPDLPVAGEPFVLVAEDLEPPPEQADPIRAAVLARPVAEEVGFVVLGRQSVLLVYGAGLLAILALALVLRRSRRPELLGWLGPLAALGVAGGVLVLGELSRQAEPTVAVAQIVEPGPGTEDAAVHGVLAAYRPDSGPADVGAEQGGLFELDPAGLEGQQRKLVLTGIDQWHWEDLSLPGGVRLAPFRYTARLAEPMRALARLGPAGIEGEVKAGPFRNLSDALLLTPGSRRLAIRNGADGSFHAGPEDVLPRGQFLAGAVLTDRQQRRQALYHEFLDRPAVGRLKDRSYLLAWADPVDMHFRLVPGARTVGGALLVLPLQWQPAPAGTRVTVPGPLIACGRIVNGARVPPILELHQALTQELRFQLPPAALPLQLESARLVIKMEAPSRRVTISRQVGGQFVELHHADSPLDPIRLEWTGAKGPQLDAEGGLQVQLAVGNPLQGPAPGAGRTSRSEKWRIEYLELEVTGRTP